MKKLFPCIIMLLLLWCAPVYGFSGGSGTVADPYLVANVSDLVEIRSLTANLALHYKQTASIDLFGYDPGDGNGWIPIAGGGTGDLFTGSYDGQHYTISNLTIDRPITINVGLFGHVGRGGVIRNVCLEDVAVVGARGTGSLIGRVTGDATTLIERCSAGDGTVTGDAATGGLIGSHNSWQETAGGTDNPVVSQCFADINVIMSANGSDKQKFGGLAGCSQKGTIIDSYARGSVDITAATLTAPAQRVGGLAGCIIYRGELIRCYSTGTITVNQHTTYYGGLVGRVSLQGQGNDGVVVDSYWDTQTSGMTTSAGGFPRTTAQMKTQSTYATFDFTNIWGIDPAKNDGYPYLLWEDYDPEDPPPPPTVDLRSRWGLELDGVIDHVIIDHDGALDVSADDTVTVEAWVRKASDQTDAAGTGDIAVLQNHDSYNLFLADGNEPAFSIVDDSGTTHTASSDFPLETGKWYHLAGTFDNSTVKIYINGFEYTSGTVTPGAVGIQDTGSRVGVGVNVTGLENIGGVNYPSEGFLHGAIDEVRIWNTARTEANIRDTMCKKLAGTETGLVGYWRLDEAYGLVCVDDSPNDNDGTIVSASRGCSAAPVGDTSTHDYTDDYSVTDTVGDEQLTVEEDGGTWSAALKSAIQVYRVSEAPDYLSGPPRWKLFPGTGFWGVFMTGGGSATYKISYNYDVSSDGFPGISDEANLRLAYRDTNCEPWKDLGATLGANPLTRSGLTGTEFILGSDMEPRNAIDFDGTDDYVEIADDNTLDLDDQGTLEAWIYPDALTAGAGIVIKGTSGINNVCYGFGLGGGSNVFTGGASSNIDFVVGNTGGGVYRLTGTNALSTGRWYHVACVWKNNTTDEMTIYINGVQEATSSATIDNAATTNNEAVNIGREAVTPTYFNGPIDEVRIWNTARTEANIRDTMCQKLSGSESGLVGYWRFDEETDSTTCPDQTTNNNDGTMTGFSDVRAARICSSAPIGDDSAYGYYDGGTLSPVIAQLTHSDGDYLKAEENTGTWTGTFSGIQIYQLDEAAVYPPDLWTTPSPPYSYTTPNGLSAPSGWSSVDYFRYWGVFTTDWLNSPKTYDVTYYYNGNPSVPVDDSVLGLAKRDDYCDRSWADSGATLITGADTLTKTGEAGTEYILGGQGAPLAIALAYFTAEMVDGCVFITWKTATEIETAGFYLWRSDQKDGGYTRIDESFTPTEALTETTGATYEYWDCNVDEASAWYYKLEAVDYDQAQENAFYGPIGPTARSLKTAGTDDASGASGRSGCFISVTAK
ncbi:MAG: LamG domain-containing protein [Deltaproteobacteria bacterium]|nr:LamG domain-containing protein [Deltaproteobacteria bacterium]